MTSGSHNSGYFPGGATKLVSGSGDALMVVGGTVDPVGLTLTLPGSGGTSGPRARVYGFSIIDGGPSITSPYPLILSALLPGTITGISVSMTGASGANFNYTAQHRTGGGSLVSIPGLTNIHVSDGEQANPNDGTTASYPAPLRAVPTGGNTYVVGDQVVLSFAAVGGTFTTVTVQLEVTE